MNKKMINEEIREDLKNIRYYYLRKKTLDESFNLIGNNDIVEKIEFYNDIMKSAPLQLYDTYVALYVNNYTQESWANLICYTRESVNAYNRKLLKFIQGKIIEKRQLEVS